MVRAVLRELFPPLHLPLKSATVWGVSLGLIAVVTLLDIFTPASLTVGTLLVAAIALAALGESRRTILALTGWSVTANLLAGLLNATRDGSEWLDIANRAVSILAMLLVSVLTLRAREASEQAAHLAEEEKQLRRERALRELMSDVGGPLGQAEFVERAASALLKLSGASSVEIGALERAMLRSPYALALAADLQGQERPSRLNQRVPLEFLAHPVDAGNVWATEDGHISLARLRRPTEGDLLVMLTSPHLPPGLLGDAIHALQPLLERTALLDDLRDNRRQLAERGELLRDLVYAFSHDLRTPLLANAMNMQAALKGAYGPLPAEYQNSLQNGLAANESLLSLADQLLLVAKYESGENTGEDTQPVNLREVVLGVMNDLQGRADSRQITLQPDLEGVTVPGRRHDLRRAVQNLLDNAVKFSPPGGRVSVTLTQRHEEAQLSVQDDGPGVPSEQQPTLFQRFRSGGAGRGSGLGLYLTRKIAQAHGGQVQYARTSKATTQFTLTLPTRDVHA